MQKEGIEMKFKKTIVSLTGLALLSVDSLTLSSNPVSAAENDDSTTVTLKVKKAEQSQVNSKSLLDSNIYAKNLWDIGPGGGAPGGLPRTWGPGYTWHWWG